MTLDPVTSLASIRAELEAGWMQFDDIYDAFGAHDWTRKFGKTWTYADQPYHLAYFDRMIATHLALGANVPEEGRLHFRSMGDINVWNAREFAKRAPGHSAVDSLKAMREARAAIRAQLDHMTDADLERRTWMPLVFGWTTARGVLQAIIIHNVAEYWKLWLRTGKRGAEPSPSAVHLRLDFMMNFMPATLNRELAAKKPFTVVWQFDGPGGGAWTFSVRRGACTVSESLTRDADLAITMKPENFHKLVAKMTPPPFLILTRQMRIKGFGAMGTFAKMFPEPRPDQVIEVSSAAPGAVG